MGLVRVFSDVDSDLLSGLKHLVRNITRNWRGDAHTGTVYIETVRTVDEAVPYRVDATLQTAQALIWPTEGHDYEAVFGLLEKNYFATRGRGGFGHSAGAQKIEVEHHQISVLENVLAD